MSGDVSIDVGSALYYVEDRLFALFGRDASTTEWNSRLQQRMRSAIEQARWVQCIGMSDRVPIEDIYQPVNLNSNTRGITDVWDLIKKKENAIIFAGPGRGKSTLLNWLTIQLLKNTKNKPVTPLLFILRSNGAVADLTEFADRLSKGKRPDGLKEGRPLLLVDGYDEIDIRSRKAVSAALTTIKAESIGSFILTCRTFYDVLDLSAAHLSLAAFDTDDTLAFISAFARAFEVPIDAETLTLDLQRRGFEDFLSHPLMLTLICILKSGPLPDLPRNTLGLLKRVFDTLTIRWDQARGIQRRSSHPLDGEERVKCLMRIAYEMRELRVGEEVIERTIRDHLRMIQRRGIDARILLREMAQWYGVLIPTEQDKWQFVHKSIHDYLAARFWVESGRFKPRELSVWDARTAYALCLAPDDATWGIEDSIERGDSLQVLSECMYNYAPFRADSIAKTVVSYFERQKDKSSFGCSGQLIHASGPADLFRLASEQFLMEMLTVAAGRTSDGAAAVLLCCLGEAYRRGRRVKAPEIYAEVVRQFGTPGIRVQVSYQYWNVEFYLGDAFMS